MVLNKNFLWFVLGLTVLFSPVSRAELISDPTALEAIEAKNLLAPGRCHPDQGTFKKIKETLISWDKSGTQQHKHLVQLMRVNLGLQEFVAKRQRTLPMPVAPSGFVLFCDESQEIYSIGVFDSKDADWIKVVYLVSAPHLGKKGGGTAVIRHAVRIALALEKKGVQLVPEDDVANSFYLNRGFLPQVVDRSTLILTRDKIAEKFPEFLQKESTELKLE